MSLFRKITETVTKGVSTATEKAQQTVEITRVHAQISGKRKEMEKLFAGIGEAVYGGYKAKDIPLAEAKAIPICEEIDRLQSEIADVVGCSQMHVSRIIRSSLEKLYAYGSSMKVET